MKIAQVAPVFERVPPKAYGGTERVISYLTEELARDGHEVTLFATGDSVTQATLISALPAPIRFDGQQREWLAYQTVMFDQLAAMTDCFDIIHFHTDFLHFPLAKALGVPHVTTLHGRLDLPALVPVYRHFDDVPLISISESQRKPLPWVNWCATIHHGLPPDLYEFHPTAENYFAFVGRISPEKRADRAIEIALRCETPLYLAAKVDHGDQAYFETVIKPMLDHPLIDYIGEIDESKKRHLLGGARALLFPIDWPEPFGLVMIESLACGTPVIAYGHGAVPEILEDGVNGFIATDQEQAVQAAAKVDLLDRKMCRHTFEQRFTAQRMAQQYLAAYRRVQDRQCRMTGDGHGQ